MWTDSSLVQRPAKFIHRSIVDLEVLAGMVIHHITLGEVEECVAVSESDCSSAEHHPVCTAPIHLPSAVGQLTSRLALRRTPVRDCNIVVEGNVL